jgi:hypothetical protein
VPHRAILGQPGAADGSARSTNVEAVPSIVAATGAHEVAVRVGRVGWNTRFLPIAAERRHKPARPEN